MSTILFDKGDNSDNRTQITIIHAPIIFTNGTKGFLDKVIGIIHGKKVSENKAKEYLADHKAEIQDIAKQTITSFEEFDDMIKDIFAPLEEMGAVLDDSGHDAEE